MGKKLICVTGGGGYLGSWIVKTLLESGYDVRATIRSSHSDSYKHLTTGNFLNNKTGMLELFEADLLVPNSFDAAFDGCEAVIHTASPFILNRDIKNPELELMQPAILGTKNVLDSINKFESIKNVVFTSSIVAITSVPSSIKTFNESDWSIEANIKDSPYHLSKRMAEETAWEMYKQQNRWSLVVINPGFIIGPVLGSRINDGSIGFIKDLFNGKFFFCPDISLPLVDVRDVAIAHIRALEKVNIAQSQRYLCVAQTISMKQLGNIIRKKYSTNLKLIMIPVPKWVCYIFLPLLHMTRSRMEKIVGVEYKFCNDKIRKDLDLNFIDAQISIHDMVESMAKYNIIKT